MLCWRSFCHGCIHNMQSFDLAQSVVHIVLVAFLAFSFTFPLITALFFNNTYKYIIIISKIQCHSINARHHSQVRSTGCSGLQTGCLLHYHTADSGSTSGCFFISQHIWIKIYIVLAILGTCIKSLEFSTRKWCIWIRISGRQVDELGMFTSGIVLGWGGWRSGHRWHWLWSWVSVSGGWRCNYSFASHVCIQILCGAIFARKASGHVVLMKHSLVSFHRSLRLFMLRKLNTLLHLFPDLGARIFDQILCLLHCGMR